ncbi:MAG: NAD-dependent epimerase/dehydratase family protein, partial [Actinomycetota bacterium]
MTTIAVTGAAGAVGNRVVDLLARQAGGEKVVAVDRASMRPPSGVDFRLTDLTKSEPDLFAGCDTVVHLAEDPGRRTDPGAAVATLEAVLDRVAAAACPHLVVLSSALVYGARAGNPVPLTEHHDRRPNPDLGYAVAKAAVEERAERWAETSGTQLAVLRPTTTLSERGASYVAIALRAALAGRAETIDAPLQFLHHDDLAAAVALVARR